MRTPLRAAAAAAVAAIALALAVTPAQADPGSARIDAEQPFGALGTRLTVYSPAMGRSVVVDVLRPPNPQGSRPTLYLLDGAEAHDEESGWTAMTRVRELAAGENVNVVLPVGGAHAYYTDWQHPDPVMGKPAWETFLTRELPPLIDGRLGGNGVNAIAGASMGGTAALTLATRHPQLYRAVASYSNCADTTNPVNQRLIEWDVARGGGRATNMWGGFADPAWVAHNPQLGAGQLRGKTIYLSSGNGVPGRYNNLLADPPMETVQGVFGEFGALVCTSTMASALTAAGVPFTMNLRPIGTHKWGYWDDELHASWPLIVGALR